MKNKSMRVETTPQWYSKMFKKSKDKALMDRLINCPYKHYEYSDAKGEITKVSQPTCNTGPGDWCYMCKHYTMYKKQQHMNKKLYLAKKKRRHRRMKTTGLAPHLWEQPRILTVGGL